VSDTNPLGQFTTSSDWNKGKRVRENVSVNAKGHAQIDITIEYLNQDTSKIKNNPRDIADIDDVTLEEEIVKRLIILEKKLGDIGIICTFSKKKS